jgi:hypothetical protein
MMTMLLVVQVRVVISNAHFIIIYKLTSLDYVLVPDQLLLMKCPLEKPSFWREVFGNSVDFFHLLGDLPVLAIAVNENIF